MPMRSYRSAPAMGIATSLAIALLVAVARAGSEGVVVLVGSEFQVNGYTTGFQGAPALAPISSEGDFVVVWHGYAPGASRSVLAQRFDKHAQRIGSEFQISTLPASYNPAVAGDPRGGFIVAWENFTRADVQLDIDVLARRYSSLGEAIGTEFQVNTCTPSDQSAPAVAADSFGNFVVVWASFAQDGSYSGIFAQRYNPDGEAVGTEFQVNTYTQFVQFAPVIVADPSGGFAIVWRSFGQDGSAYGIFGRLYDSSGSATTSEFAVNTHTLGNQAEPSIAAQPPGGFVVVWQSGYPLDSQRETQDGSGYGVFGQRYDSNGLPVSGEFRVNSYTLFDQQAPAVVTDSSGAFLVAWQDGNATGGQGTRDGSESGIFGQIFDSAGTVVGTEFQINTFTVHRQNSPSIASITPHGFVVTWASNYQDGDGYGVFGQRLEPPTPRPEQETGQSCVYDIECRSAFCTDAVCCDRRCEAQNEFCALPGHEGVCVAVAFPTTTPSTSPTPTKTPVPQPNGSACGGSNECVSTFCVDGVCCERECDKETESCAVPGLEGTCVKLLLPTITPTSTLPPTVTATSGRTPTSSPTPEEADHTQTATRTPATGSSTATPTANRCVGDCNRDGSVTSDELVVGVSITLERLPPERCQLLDRNGDSTIQIDEIVGAVDSALNSCRPRVIPLGNRRYRPLY